jgi:hypothetical protein
MVPHGLIKNISPEYVPPHFVARRNRPGGTASASFSPARVRRIHENRHGAGQGGTMAETKRERILAHVAAELGRLSWVRGVLRRSLERPREAGELAGGSQLPLVAITGSLPIARGSLAGQAGLQVSELELAIHGYGLERETPDSVLSVYAADVRRVVIRDGTQGGLALWTKPLERQRADMLPPYYGFTLTFAVGFLHGMDGA